MRVMLRLDFLVATALMTVLSCSTGQAQSFYAEAAKPYKGTTIRVLDEITPLQETLSKIVPEFEKETGIKVEWELLNHFEVISKGQADMLSGRGYYDAVMLHGLQYGPMLEAKALRPLDDLMANPKLANPALDISDLIQKPYKSLAFSGGKQYSFLNWNYNQVYWVRADLLNNKDEQTAFNAKYKYDLAPAKTPDQMRDIAEFFTRKKGEKLAGEVLAGDFYGIVIEGIKGGTTFGSLWNNLIKNYGGDIIDANGAPTFDRPENIQALKMWAALWKFAPPGVAEYSLVDVPTVMGNGIAAQSIAWSDFVLGIDVPGKSPLAGKFAYAPVPVKQGLEANRSAETEPSGQVISAASKNPEATFLFLQWLVDKAEQQKLIALGGGGVPIRDSSWALLQIKDSANPTLYSAMRQTLAISTAKPKMPKYFEVYDALSSVAQEVGLGKLTPEEGAKKGQDEMVKLCQKKCLL
jgi:multiple sugar transport system substrate-binding protein